jgi:hypothetical protein
MKMAVLFQIAFAEPVRPAELARSLAPKPRWWFAEHVARLAAAQDRSTSGEPESVYDQRFWQASHELRAPAWPSLQSGDTLYRRDPNLHRSTWCPGVPASRPSASIRWSTSGPTSSSAN